jgi:hypothetical protein
MSLNEKAHQLVNEFYQPLGMLQCRTSSTAMWEYSKKSAMIAIDEIIKVCPYVTTENIETVEQARASDNQFVSYWESLKNEINKI